VNGILSALLAGLIVGAAWSHTEAATAQYGIAKYYSPGLMQHVYSVRIRQGLVRPGWTGGFAATPYCRSIGRIIHARLRDPRSGLYNQAHTLLVVDCSQYRDLQRHLDEGLILETDYRTARDDGWTGDGKTGAVVTWTAQNWRP